MLEEDVSCEFATAQWIGRRDSQEDCLDVMPLGGGVLGVVADGMGGHRKGEVASALVAQVFMEAFEFAHRQHLPVGICLENAVNEANVRLGQQLHYPGESGSTLLGVYVVGRELFWVSVGDSPLYLWRGDSICRLNEDHSMRPIADKLYKEGQISLQTALRERNVLRSALMGEEIDLMDLRDEPLPLQAGDVIFACSDGMQTWSEILRIPSFVALRQAEQAGMQSLLVKVLEQVEEMLEPGQDNASTLAIKVN